MTIILTAATLTKNIKAALSTYKSIGDKIHVLTVSCLYHSATTGDTTPLNMLYEGLRSNDQQALKLYVRRTQVITGLDGADPEGLPSETILAALSRSAILDMQKNKFTIREGRGHTSAEASAYADILASRFYVPDGKVDKRVLDRNNFAEVKTLGDDEALKLVLTALKKATTSSDKQTVSISPSLMAKLTKIQEQLAA